MTTPEETQRLTSTSPEISQPSEQKKAESGSKSTLESQKDFLKEQVSVSSMVHFLKFYGLPVFSIGLFFLIIFFTVIPNIRYIFSTIDEIDQLRNEDERLASRIERLVQLRNETAERQELITKINFLVPTGKSEVVKFRERVAETTTNESLKLENSKSGETILSTDAPVTEVANFTIIQIPSEFEISGAFENFRNFLNTLYTGQDFFIVDQMALNTQVDSDGVVTWQGRFNLTKYQFFAEDGFDEITSFAQISEEALPNPATLLFLETFTPDTGSETEEVVN